MFAPLSVFLLNIEPDRRKINETIPLITLGRSILIKSKQDFRKKKGCFQIWKKKENSQYKRDKFSRLLKNLRKHQSCLHSICLEIYCGPLSTLNYVISAISYVISAALLP